MKTTFSASILLAAVTTFAAVPVSFTSGTPAKADDVNKNFASLDSAIQKKADASAVTVLQAALTTKADQSAATSLQSTLSGLQGSKVDTADLRRVRDTVRAKVDSGWVNKKITSSQPTGTLLASNNLKDLADTAAARKNLGLGPLATKSTLTAADVGALPTAGGTLTGPVSGFSATFKGPMTSNQDNTAVAVAGGAAGMGSYYGGPTTAWFGRAADFKTYRGYLSDATGMSINEPSWNSHFQLKVGGVDAIDAVSSGGTAATTSITLNGNVGINGNLALDYLSVRGNEGTVLSGNLDKNWVSNPNVPPDGNGNLIGWNHSGGTKEFNFVNRLLSTDTWQGGFDWSILKGANWTQVMSLTPSGDLYVIGSIKTKGSNIPDYVFEPDYRLTPLSEVEAYTKEHKHLPEVPSATEIGKSGLDLAQMNLVLLKKVEELTLHAIAQQKEIADLKSSVQELKNR